MIQFLQTWPNPFSVGNPWFHIWWKHMWRHFSWYYWWKNFLSGWYPVTVPICFIPASSQQILVTFLEKYCLQKNKIKNKRSFNITSERYIVCIFSSFYLKSILPLWSVALSNDWPQQEFTRIKKNQWIRCLTVSTKSFCHMD